MLVLTRYPSEEVVMTLSNGEQIVITFLGVKRQQTRFGIIAPKSVTVDRREVYERKQAEKNGEADGNR